MSYNSGVILLVISNQSPDYSLNCTPFSPITITNYYCSLFCFVVIVNVVVAILGIITSILMYIEYLVCYNYLDLRFWAFLNLYISVSLYHLQYAYENSQALRYLVRLCY